MSQPVRSSRPRARVDRRVTPAAAPTSAAPAAAQAEPAPHVSTRITTTDYGYVVGELRRLALLTVVIIVLLLAIWLVVG